jgi:hypothetical protein
MLIIYCAWICRYVKEVCLTVSHHIKKLTLDVFFRNKYKIYMPELITNKC